ncbi:MAG TPA: DUF4388 domain-containing protein, partial [Thermoanaerobaculia bacterium]|nr:DUF4388 domain-containing protein [Thermoanaerobaculia bacterium]
MLRSTETVVVTTASGPQTVRVANPKGAFRGGLGGGMEIWYYRGDRVPRGISFRELRFEFVTQRLWYRSAPEGAPRASRPPPGRGAPEEDRRLKLRLRVTLAAPVPKTLNGTLDTFSLADLLQWLEINRLSGRVSISRGEDRRTIDLKDG